MRRALPFLVPLAVLACGEKLDPVRTVDAALLDLPGGTVAWCGEIRPLLADPCAKCHSSTLSGADRQGAPVDFNFDKYETAAPLAESALGVMSNGFMPPGGPRVPDAALALMQVWIDAGTPLE